MLHGQNLHSHTNAGFEPPQRFLQDFELQGQDPTPLMLQRDGRVEKVPIFRGRSSD